MDNLARLVYLADTHRVRIPNSLVRYVSFGPGLVSISERGLEAAIIADDLPEDQFKELYRAGENNGKKKTNNPGTPEEFRLLVGREIMSALDTARRKGEIPFQEYVNSAQIATDFITSKSDEMFAATEISLRGAALETEFVKWDSGLEPLDLVFGGLYQGIFTALAKPGHGKTSVMWTLYEMLRRTNASPSLFYYSVEIPEQMMLWRTAPSRKRTKFQEEDRLFCGEWSTAEILERIHKDPNPERIIIIDGPDAMTAGSGEGKRFALERVYRDLLSIKQASKAVFVTSQIRRTDSVPTLESGAEAWQKAWYSDGMFGITKRQPLGQGITSVRFNVVKNRFGPEGRSLDFNYNYATMSWDLPGAQKSRAEVWDTEDDW